MMTCTRRGAATLNSLCLKALYPKRSPKATLPGDPDSNPLNYQSREMVSSKPLEVPIFIGMKIYLTSNVSKENDFVNGMLCTVEAFDFKSRGLKVKTATGKTLMVYRWTNPYKPNSASYYPIRPGYASTILKFQGAGLPHVTIWLDCPKIPGAAYSALSRVSTRKDYLLAGWLRPEHFTPTVG